MVLEDGELELTLGDLFEGIALSAAAPTIAPRATDVADAIASCEAGSEPLVAVAAAFARYRGREPFVLRGLASHWPAVNRWKQPASLAALALDDEEVLVLRSRDGRRFLKRDCDQSTGSLADVVAQLGADRGVAAPPIYARAPLSGGVRADCDLTAIEALAGAAAKPANCGLWLGLAGNVTPFHYDLCHGFLVQVVGTKTFTLVEPIQWRAMYPRELTPELSEVDFEAWRGLPSAASAGADPIIGSPDAADACYSTRERQRHPKFVHARLRTVTLESGDVLYTPPYWWHHVESGGDGLNVSVLVPFDQTAVELAQIGEHNLCHHR
jgi:hypothetical protein